MVLVALQPGSFKFNMSYLMHVAVINIVPLAVCGIDVRCVVARHGHPSMNYYCIQSVTSLSL